MNRPGHFVGLLCLLVISLGAAVEARADTVLVDTSQMLSGSQSVVVPFSVAGAGTVTATLSDLAWTERFASLSFAISTVEGVFEQLGSAGTLRFQAEGPGQYFVHVFGRATGAFNLGVYSLNVSFEPVAPPVPLPAGIALFASGLAGLAAAKRRRSQKSHHSFV